MRTFRSDNNAGLCPEAMQALIEANDASHEIGYSDDSYSTKAVAAFKRVFGQDTGVFFVATGTAANTLAIASLTEPWQQVLCHSHSHCNADESTAPERFTHCRVTGIHTHESEKISVADLQAAATFWRGDVHQPQPGVFSLSNSTEFGRVYAPEEVRALCEAAHHAGFRVHMDGARFANAVASLGCDPRDITVNAGVDALSFGGTKNGLASGEAVLFFAQGDRVAWRRACEVFPFHRKATGHLLSKHRFVSAPFAATLEGDAWLGHAAHANAMAKMLGDGLERLGLAPRFPVEANAVFVTLPEAVDTQLRQRGHGYYPFGEAAWRLHRLMCAHDTTIDDVTRLLADVATALGQDFAASRR
jgi:threonine aldolase